MKLKVWVPTEVFLEEEVTSIKGEAENGWFGMLPRHVGFVTALVPGILSFQRPGQPTEYLAVDHGILVKCGGEVCVSVRNAVRGGDLGTLQEAVEKRFRMIHDKEQTAREFEAKLEADLARRLVQVEKHG